jgi:hypothetical protein
MAEKQIAMVNLGNLNPVKLGKDGYVRTIESAIEQTTSGSGHKTDPFERRAIATFMARDILRCTMEKTAKDIEAFEMEQPKKFKKATKFMIGAAGVSLLSAVALAYSEHANLQKLVEVSKDGLLVSFVLTMYGMANALDGAFSSFTSRMLRKRLSKISEIESQLGMEIKAAEIAKDRGSHWRN